ncbi:MAG: chemotaxis protein CheA [Anaerolineae bacterium]|nr:chemotaxis protein CheA [Anaerolineae bacterium]
MELVFDLDQDEMPIFLAETDEQLQVLDEGLIRLEQESEDIDLVQALFRAAHTLKGTSGMIGHKRMVTLTHALENALDGVRKREVEISTAFVDLCLEAVDALRLLREEVVQRRASSVNVEALAERFSSLSTFQEDKEQIAVSMPKVQEQAAPAESGCSIHVEVFIAQDSIASAARAMQVLMTLQGFGEIVRMEPSQEEIETAKPVQRFEAQIKTQASIEEIRKEIGAISEIEKVVVEALDGGEKTASVPSEAPTTIQPPAEAVRNLEWELGRTTQPQAKTAAEKTVRTSVERLDKLMNLVGELITDRNRLYQVRGSFEARFRGDAQVDNLSETVAHIGRITDQLQKEVMSIRMLPVSNVFHKFPRMVRDLSNKFGKKLELVIEGEETELDRSVIEELQDPLIHLVRNSIDHGVETPEVRLQNGKPETARILMSAQHEQGRILLTVEDDGRGIDVERVKAAAVQKGLITEAEAASMGTSEAINLIFMSGFSTAKVVSDISGRGVGLDIVRNNIQRLNGNISVETWPGRGTRFQITLPLTLAIVPTLLVKVEPCIFAVPLVTVLETLRITQKDIRSVNNFPVIVLREKVLPLLYLSKAFGLPNQDASAYQHIVVVASGSTQMGLVVDTLLGQEEVVVKSLGPLVGEVYGISSAAILGDGQVILILDVQDLSRHVGAHYGR